MSSRLQGQAAEMLPQQQAGLVVLSLFLVPPSAAVLLDLKGQQTVLESDTSVELGGFCAEHPTWVPKRCNTAEGWLSGSVSVPLLACLGGGSLVRDLYQEMDEKSTILLILLDVSAHYPFVSQLIPCGSAPDDCAGNCCSALWYMGAIGTTCSLPCIMPYDADTSICTWHPAVSFPPNFRKAMKVMKPDMKAAKICKWVKGQT